MLSDSEIYIKKTIWALVAVCALVEVHNCAWQLSFLKCNICNIIFVDIQRHACIVSKKKEQQGVSPLIAVLEQNEIRSGKEFQAFI